MTPDRWARVKDIFQQAMEMPPEERNSFIAHACGDDSPLREEVEAMVEDVGSSTVLLGKRADDKGQHGSRNSPPVFAAGEIISARYHVLSFVAKGGMGEVYEVEDLELRTRVALKVICLARGYDAHALERFRRELKLARTVTHPNVCRVFDVGHHLHAVHGDVTYLTMEFLRGETLETLLRSQGPMTCDQALPLIQQMVAALGAAHRLGIVHRDLKPGNIILVRDTVPVELKVTDFGLATDLGSEDETSPTSLGGVLGTPEYMAPEQFYAQATPQTDIYALGLVIFKMLTGRLPSFRRAGLKSNLLGELPAETSARWKDVIAKCLASEPEDRFSSVENVWRGLVDEALPTTQLTGQPVSKLSRYRYLVGSLIALIAVYVGLVAAHWLPRPFRSLPEQKHIAVLQFQNIGNQPSTQAFSDGIVESLTSKLSQLERFQKSFWVVPSGDARSVKSLDEAYRRLNVTLAVTGSVEQTDKGVILTANLVDAKNHKQLASRTIHAPANDLEELQDRVWKSVADMVDLQISPEEESVVNAGGTRQPGAYELYEQGMGFLRRTNDGADQAILVFSKALQRDPNYALAYAGLGEAYADKYRTTKDPQWISKAVESGQRAVALDDHLAPAHVTLGRVYQRTGQVDKALQEYRTALQYDPTVVNADYHMAEIYETQGKFDQAEEIYKSIINRRPGYSPGYSGLGTFYYRHGQFQKAAEQFKAMIDLQPDNSLGYEDLAGVYMAMSRYQDAVDMLKTGLSYKQTASGWSNLGAAYMYLKRWPEAVEAMKKATELSPHDDVLWRNLGDSYRQAPGKEAEAKAAYQKALETGLDELKVNPNDTEVLSGVALYNAHLGNRGDAESYIGRALKLAPKNSDVLFTSALVYEIIGHREQALEAVEKSVDAGYALADIQGEPELTSLRTDPRFQKWVKQKNTGSVGSRGELEERR